MVDYVHRFLPVFASLILSGHLVGCAGVSPKVDAGSTVSVMFPAPPPDAALAPAPVAVPAPAAPGVEGPPSTDAVLVNGKPVSGTEIIGEWKRMDGPRSCWLGKQADGASQIKCYPSVRRSRVGRSNFSANRRATTASLGYRAFSVKTVCFGPRLCKNVKSGGKTNCGNDLVSCGVLGWAVKTHGLSLKFSVVE